MTRVGIARLAAACALAAPSLAAAAPERLQITNAGTTYLEAGVTGLPGIDVLELDPATANEAGESTLARARLNRTIAKGVGRGPTVRGNGRAKSNPTLGVTFDGLDFFDQRYANGGNQFSVEPPDQGLCAGNGFVLEAVNDVLRVWDAAGAPATGVVDLNTFYGYAPAIDRAGGAYGPEVLDPSCYFDPDTQRWFVLALTLDRVGTTSRLAGTNHLDVAVSATADPLGAWNVYRVPAQNDGTQGTPDHGCTADLGGGKVVHGPCFGDYPHVGADANGLFLTTNEFEFFADGFVGAQIYALPKRALAAGAASVPVVLFNTADPSLGISFDGYAGFPGFTIWPAQSPGGIYAGARGGSEFLLSSQAVFNDSGTDDRLRLWTVSNTRSLDDPAPAPVLSASVVGVLPYGVPPDAVQKPGSTPLRECLADTSLQTYYGPGCWRLFLASGGPFPNPIAALPSNDSRMQQVVYANGKLWGALDTAATVGGADVAGIAYFVLNPRSGTVHQQGVLAVPGANLTYPALAVTPSGRGVVAFTLLGPNDFPSAAYAGIDAKVGAGEVHVAAAGAGPDDGFTCYEPFSDRPRWGDYGAAAADGESIWIASEYVAQTCSYADFVNSGGICGRTRAAYGNWATRISRITP